MGDYFSSITAIIFVVLVILFPFVVLFLMIKHRKQLSEERALIKFGMLYEEMDSTRIPALLFHVVFCLRRLFMTLLIFFLESYAFVQVQLMIFMSLLLLIYDI